MDKWDLHLPFTTATPFNLPSPQEVRLSVYDVLGRKIALLLDARREAGAHTVRFKGETLPSGPYLRRLETASHIVEKTMILQR